jgi:hypothetical protein
VREYARLARPIVAASLIALAALLAAGSAGAREFADPAADFHIDLVDRGAACVLAPADRYEPDACAQVTTMRPQMVPALQSSDSVYLVGAEVVQAGDWSYALDILREPHPPMHDLEARDAEAIAGAFVDKLRASMAQSGVAIARDGAAELSREGGVQIVTFAATATVPDGSAMAAFDRSVMAVVLAEGFTYTVELRGPSSHAGDLRDIVQKSVATVHATPFGGMPPDRGVMSSTRVLALVLLAAATLGLTVFVLRFRRGKAA